MPKLWNSRRSRCSPGLEDSFKVSAWGFGFRVWRFRIKFLFRAFVVRTEVNLRHRNPPVEGNICSHNSCSGSNFSKTSEVPSSLLTVQLSMGLTLFWPSSLSVSTIPSRPCPTSPPRHPLEELALPLVKALESLQCLGHLLLSRHQPVCPFGQANGILHARFQPSTSQKLPHCHKSRT